ncbi:pentatricopeptide repeat-containing protein At4g02750-like [Selaginella moellendorffii]|uniref:pentatricopeptide repeat-containing protein At4g02750-like n=1 Tax=Selaginella moellendorffii TaxID=88036 RepID=UPI000D1CD9E3|nr:pentatricopeptide repeat-containing protein At4g02750-like [Selaginella moellendorffii]|eukprot:XP_024519737.1 pentatricopeptide repeat-containing protein At4g02750-like [Selaginella moellendorffii]
MISSFAQAGLMDEASTAFDRISQRNVVSWTSTAAGFAQSGLVAQAKHAFQSMPERNWITWTAVVAAFAQSGHLGEARDLLARIPHPDVKPWAEMATAYARNGHGKVALELLKPMELLGIPPDEATCVNILSACWHVGLVEEGRQCFLYMLEDRCVAPHFEIYCSMVDLLARAGQLPQAEELIQSMPYLPDDTTWGALLGGARIHSDIQCGLRAAWSAFEAHPENPGPMTNILLE